VADIDAVSISDAGTVSVAGIDLDAWTVSVAGMDLDSENVGVTGLDLDCVASGRVHDSCGSWNRAKEAVIVYVLIFTDADIEFNPGIVPEKMQFAITNPRSFVPPSRVNTVPEPLKMQ
jgi:hypothetical protein